MEILGLVAAYAFGSIFAFVVSQWPVQKCRRCEGSKLRLTKKEIKKLTKLLDLELDHGDCAEDYLMWAIEESQRT